LERFTERAIEVIKQIPAGKVMTYGQVARIAGSPRGARQVVRILHSLSRAQALPWHRVINAKGEIAFQEEEPLMIQKMELEAEGIEFVNERKIDLKVYQHHPNM
jgi:methylated-DNA-protein-cysteine methyltransferase related protein